MKKVLMLAMSIYGLLASSAVASNPSLAGSQLVWVGLDYSHVRLIGGPDVLKDPEAIFARQFASWNHQQLH